MPMGGYGLQSRQLSCFYVIYNIERLTNFHASAGHLLVSNLNKSPLVAIQAEGISCVKRCRPLYLQVLLCNLKRSITDIVMNVQTLHLRINLLDLCNFSNICVKYILKYKDE